MACLLCGQTGTLNSILVHFVILNGFGWVVRRQRWVYLWQSGSALQVIGKELKIATKNSKRRQVKATSLAFG